MQQTLTLLLPVHNRGSMTADFILHANQVLPSNIDLKVVVFDDGCTDATVAMAQQAWPLATVVELDGHAYWGGALNAVARYIKDQANAGIHSDYYLLCNDDIRFPSQKSFAAGLEAVDEQTLVCARGLMVEHLRIASSANWHSEQELLAEPGTHYNPSRGSFTRATEKRRANVASTWAMLTTQQPWLHAVAIPSSIPHYLSDYWLTYNLGKLGFQLIHPEEFKCLVSSETTRNKPRSRKKRWARPILARMNDYVTKTSPEYLPARITFYRQGHPAIARFARVAKLWIVLKFSEATLAILRKLDKRSQRSG